MSYYEVMFSWAQKQRILVVVVPLGLFLLLVGVFLLIVRNRPNCANGRQDGNETGIDCGGSCRRLCPGIAAEPLVHFARAVPVGEELWGAVAYMENRNPFAGVRSAPYLFKLYDAENLLIYDRRGTAYLPPQKSIAIFEGAMQVGSRVPTRATFAFTEPLRFERMAEDPKLEIRGRRFESASGVSHLEAQLVNPTGSALSQVSLTALLFDASGNVFAASATVIQTLSAHASVPLSFTWPQEFPAPPARTEILYSATPDGGR